MQFSDLRSRRRRIRLRSLALDTLEEVLDEFACLSYNLGPFVAVRSHPDESGYLHNRDVIHLLASRLCFPDDNVARKKAAGLFL